MRIDTHCHAYPQGYLDGIKQAGIPDWDNVRGAVIPVWTSLEDRLAEMDALGVDVSVLSLSSPGVYFDDDDVNLALARVMNDFLVEMHGRSQARLYGFASIPLANNEMAVEELRRVVGRPGVVGAILPTSMRGKPIDSPEFWPFLEEADRQNLTVFVHPEGPKWMKNVGEFRIHTMINYPLETTITAYRIVFRGVLDRFPNISWVLSHLGGAIPYIYNRADWVARRFPDECPVNISQAPSEYFKRFYYDTALNYRRGPIYCALDLIGADHLVFGTDTPWAIGEPPKTVECLESIGLPKGVKEKILSKNAAKLLGIPVSRRARAR